MNYRGQLIICKKSIDTLKAFDEATIGRVLMIMFRECAGEPIDLQGESPMVQVALKLVGERQSTATDGNELHPSLSPSERNGGKKETKKGGKETNSPSHTLFARFWGVYPRKVGKPVAEKAFLKAIDGLEPDAAERLTEQMIKAVETQSSSAQWQEGERYIPHPATWLNQHRWEDEPTISPEAAQAAAQEAACAAINRELTEFSKQFAF